MKTRKTRKLRKSASYTTLLPSIVPRLGVVKNVPTEEELVCCLMGKVGFSARNISKETGLTIRQVYFTLQKARIKLWDFRNGVSDWGKRVTKTCVKRVNEEVRLLNR